MKMPCDRKCPDRNATCHGSCQKYIDWKAFLESRKDKTKQAQSEICEMIKKRAHRYQRNLRKGVKLKRYDE